MLTKLKHILFKSVKNKKLNIFSLFFLLAFIILVLSKLSKSYTETLTVDVDFINLAEDRVLTTDEDLELQIVVNTYGFNLLGYYFYDNIVAIDLQKDTYIQNDAYIWIANRALPDIEEQFGTSFKIESVQPDTLSFSFETLAVKKVPIQLNSKVTYASGYDTLKGMTLIPDSVNVIGPASEIKDLNYIETSELSLLGVKKNINTTIGLKLPDNNHTVKLSKDVVSVKAEVKKFTEGTLEIPVVINNLPADIQINYFPKMIKVSYEVSLNDYKSIKPSGFKIECDYLESMTSNTSYFTPSFKKIPDNVKRVKMKQNKIEYIITE